MPISVPPKAERPPADEAGLTLVEVLVVLAIIGIASAAAMLSVGGADRSRNVDAEARRLAQVLERATDDALVGGHPLIFAWDVGGYSLTAAKGGAVGGPHRLPEEMELVSAAKSPVRIAGDGLGPALDLSLSSDGQLRTVRYDGLNAELVSDPS